MSSDDEWNDAPKVGTVLLARYHHDDGRTYVPAGTRLEVVAVDQRWDNTHAMIFVGYEYTMQLRVLDGPAGGKRITVREQGTISTSSGPEAWNFPYPYPAWLEFVPA